MLQKQLQLKVAWTDIDIVDVLTLNRKYNIRFANNEYKNVYDGVYRLNTTLFSFSKGTNEKYYRIVGISIFDKLHKNFY